MDKITIVGMGLIGTSLGMALKKARVDAQIVGTDIDRGVANRAQRAGGSDKTEPNPLSAIQGADMVILATPVAAIEDLMKLFAPHLERGCVVTDTGSTKTEVLKWAEEYLPDYVHFVGGHPLAGKELTGPEAADSNLFEDSTYCIIPGKGAAKDAVAMVTHIAEAIGAKPYFLDQVEHDSFVAAVSHLPLVLSTMLIKVSSSSPSWSEIAKLASSGFRDLTRLASGSPEMNRDICLTNPVGLVHWIDQYIIELNAFKTLIQDGNTQSVNDIFEDSKIEREKWLANRVSPPSTPLTPLPDSTETMGGMLLGDRASNRLRQVVNWWKDDKRGKKGDRR